MITSPPGIGRKPPLTTPPRGEGGSPLSQPLPEGRGAATPLNAAAIRVKFD